MLSPQEKEVCARLRRGLSDKQIAQDLGRSEETVGFHLRNIFRKLQVRSRVLAAIRSKDL